MSVRKRQREHVGEIPPIFILSKGRYDKRSATWVLLAEDKVPFTVVVEPSEAEMYRPIIERIGGKIEVLPSDNQGVAFVRNFILNELAPVVGWFWIMDDDIQKFIRAANGQHVRVSALQMLTLASPHLAMEHSACLYSLEYEQFGHASKPHQILLNSYNNIAVCLNKALLPRGDLQYRFKVREDYDFTLQIIFHGGTTLRRRDLCFRAPSMATSAGGMTAYYLNERPDIQIQNKLFLETWAGVAKEVEKGSGESRRRDIRVSWAALRDPATAQKHLHSTCKGAPSTDPLKCSAISKIARPQSSASRKSQHESPAHTAKAVKMSIPATKALKSAQEETLSGEVKSAQLVTKQKTAGPKVMKPPGWIGWEQEIGRELHPDHAIQVGLKELTCQMPGDDVAVVPWSFSIRPPVVLGTVLAVYDGRKCFEVSPLRGFPGVPLIVTSKCYAVPKDLKRVQDCVDGLYPPHLAHPIQAGDKNPES